MLQPDPLDLVLGEPLRRAIAKLIMSPGAKDKVAQARRGGAEFAFLPISDFHDPVDLRGVERAALRRSEHGVIVGHLSAERDQLALHGSRQYDNPRLAALAEHRDLAAGSPALRVTARTTQISH